MKYRKVVFTNQQLQNMSLNELIFLANRLTYSKNMELSIKAGVRKNTFMVLNEIDIL